MKMERESAIWTAPILVGINEAGRLLDGWHDLERDGRNQVAYRATKRRAELRLDANAIANAAAQGQRETARAAASGLWILLAGSPSLLGEALVGEARVECRRRRAESLRNHREGAETIRGAKVLGALPLRLESDTWVIRHLIFSKEFAAEMPGETGGIDEDAQSGGVEEEIVLVLTIEKPVIPDRALRNGDSRELGWYVSAIGFE